MKRNKAILCLLLFFLYSAVEAGEVMRGNINFGHLQSKDTDNSKYHRTGLGFSYFFTPVKKIGNPWLEAPFLERTSSLDLEAGSLSFKDTDGDKSDGAIFDVGGTYSSKSHPIILGAYYNYYEIDYDSAVTGTARSESNSYELLLGAYLSEGSAVYFSYRKVDYDVDWNLNDGRTVSSGYKSDVYNVNLKHVHRLEGSRAFGVIFGYTIDDEEDSYGVATSKDKTVYIAPSYYLNSRNNISLTLSSRSSDNDSFEGKQYGVGFHSFVTNDLSLGVSYYQFDAKNDPDNDDKTWSVNAAWWF